MAKQTVQKDISRGICNFCQGEFAKNKMTQHLKSCRVRLANAAKQKGEEQLLFHILVEAKYRPDYWMHLEIPAVATLADLDDFLRFIWLECCGHLSEFEIGDVSYSATPADDWGTNFGGGLSLVGGKEVVSDEEEDDEEDDEKIDAQEIAGAMSEQLSLEFKTDLKNVPVGEIEQKLEQLLGENVPPDLLPIMRPLLTQMAQSLHQGTFAEDLELATEELEEEEEGGMTSELGEVLEVGEKFSYVYDFGSSSTLSLRVLNEREGVLPVEDEETAEEDETEEDEEDEFDDEEEWEEEDEIDIFVMARNEPPKLVCHICGQPATHVESASEYDAPAETALCAVHARQSEYPDELLPVVNSPRVGICGYTGEEEDVEWDDDDDDDEEK